MEVEVSKAGERIRDSHSSGIVTQKLLHGYLNNEPVRAMPDSGSVVNLMSEAYAIQRGFAIKKITDPAKTLEFFDGSTQQVEGKVEAYWSFEDDPNNPIHQKFRVYALCPHQVLPGQPVLCNPPRAQSAYVEHTHSFQRSENPDGLFDVGPISWSRTKAVKGRLYFLLLQPLRENENIRINAPTPQQPSHHRPRLHLRVNAQTRSIGESRLKKNIWSLLGSRGSRPKNERG